MDKLEQLFDKQLVLQMRLNNLPSKDNEHRRQFINMMTIALIDEVMEAIRETPFKDWKKNQEFNAEGFKEELVDAWHFLINLSLASGMSSDELYERFINKNKVNHERQDKKY